MSKHHEGVCKDEDETKMATIHDRNFGMPGCTPVWPRNNSQLCRLRFASQPTPNTSAINSRNRTNITAEVPVTPVHSTMGKIELAASM